MFEVKDIKAMLANGTSIEDIAQAAADALNQAKNEYDAEQKEAARKAAEAKKAALQKQAEKETRAGNIVNAMMQYMADFHPWFFSPEEMADFHRTFKPAELVEAIDKTMDEIKKIPAVAAELKKVPDGKPKNFCVELDGADAKRAEDAIQKFLRENSLF